jgi:hypothetical protein
MTITLNESRLSFAILSCPRETPETATDLKRYSMRVAFTGDQGKTASMVIEAENFKLALTILETLGQQYSKMTREEFRKYRDGHAKKHTCFRFSRTENPGKKYEYVTVYKPAHTRQGEIVAAFGRKAGAKNGIAEHIVLDRDTLDAIDRRHAELLAKMDKNRIKKPKNEPESEQLKQGLHAHLKAKGKGKLKRKGRK